MRTTLTAVEIHAVVIGVEPCTASDDGVVLERPGKAHAREEDVPNRLLQGGSVILRGNPYRAQGAREGAGGIDEILVEIAKFILYLAHARVPLPAQADVEGKIGLDFPVVLSEGLRTLQPHAGQALIVRGPGRNVAEQEIREARARASGIQRGYAVDGLYACGVLPGKTVVAGAVGAPSRGVALGHQHLNPEMQNVLALNQRHHIGGVKRVLDVNGVRGGRQGAYVVRAAESTINA